MKDGGADEIQGGHALATRSRNHVLASLAEHDLALLRSFLQPVELSRRQILQEQNRPLDHAYFIEAGSASLQSRTRRDEAMEVSMIGRFGVVGFPLILGTGSSPHRCVVLVPGFAQRIAAEDLRRAMRESQSLSAVLLATVQALLVQHSQTLLCNSRHRLEERLGRWILTMRDRLDANEIPVTHDMLSQLLGVRRAGVTVALKRMEELGAVRSIGRGRLMIADETKLRAVMCDCYSVVRAEYERLLSPMERTVPFR